MKKNKNFDNIVYGIRAVEELLNDSSKINSIEKILVDEKKYHTLNYLLDVARRHKVSVQYVPEVKINKLVREKNHQGILAYVVEIQYYSIKNLIEHNDKVNLILFLDRITDVRNFGAISRSAYAMGVNAILVPYKNSASINSDAIKTSSGALLKLPVCKEQNIADTLKYLKEKKFQIVACHEKTSRLIEEIDFTKPTVIILGSEHNGISKEYLNLSDTEAKIPMIQPFNSLNVSVSAGIVLYEALKQKRAQDFL